MPMPLSEQGHQSLRAWACARTHAHGPGQRSQLTCEETRKSHFELNSDRFCTTISNTILG